MSKPTDNWIECRHMVWVNLAHIESFTPSPVRKSNGAEVWDVRVTTSTGAKFHLPDQYDNRHDAERAVRRMLLTMTGADLTDEEITEVMEYLAGGHRGGE